ncbi:MAG: squalene-hopene cyclase [Limisphaerales bacterium]|nr:MAG: squalene-hopene cyclase [Limisphaerales bacterium]KAG0506780.1 MAG: squalene-hopene cyclase [Limisphaerales bacterium]TXT49234.1 MAG: squalene-hopene cyclase [Limisphaerales bacterium]
MASDNPTNPPPAPRLDRARLERALAKARAALLAERGPHGHWEGELSSSALSTATAVVALELWQRHAQPESQSAIGNRQSPMADRSSAIGDWQSAIESGLQWLAAHQNPDGGWGDTTLSFSNISTTALCWAAFGAVPGAEQRWPEAVRRAEAWLGEKCLVISNQSSVPKPSAPSATTNHSSLITNHSPPALDRERLITAIISRYGKDRTFSVPILTMCALAGRLGESKDAWRRVIQLPFELAALPQKFFAALRLPVVSYALPALIAIGQVRHHHLPTRNPLTRLLRDRARAKTLRVLERIQPPGGGFLEATPLTSFVTMSLAGSGQADHPVARRGIEFLLQSLRADGSWPIDTNLATWVTTLAVNALGPSIHEVMSAEERRRILDWLLGQQYRTVHPYTNAAPGGWAWTDLPGGVPDADDTAGALLALKTLSSSRRKEAPSELGTRNAERGAGNQSLLTSAATGEVEPRVREAAIAGVKWLLDLQNRDGGIPTFCRGWTNLPFDRSSPDITAHALRAWLAWHDEMPKMVQRKMQTACKGAFSYLDGGLVFPSFSTLMRSMRRVARLELGVPMKLVQEFEPMLGWVPLWFGNQHQRDEVNCVYGTSRVVIALNHLHRNLVADNISLRAVFDAANETTARHGLLDHARRNGVGLLACFQQRDGGWGGGFALGGAAMGTPTSVEETALAVEALAKVAGSPVEDDQHRAEENWKALSTGTDWLLLRVEDGTWTQPAPIGFYFAKLWYYERLYPMVFTVAALEAVARLEATEK